MDPDLTEITGSCKSCCYLSLIICNNTFECLKLQKKIIGKPFTFGKKLTAWYSWRRVRVNMIPFSTSLAPNFEECVRSKFKLILVVMPSNLIGFNVTLELNSRLPCLCFCRWYEKERNYFQPVLSTGLLFLVQQDERRPQRLYGWRETRLTCYVKWKGKFFAQVSWVLTCRTGANRTGFSLLAGTRTLSSILRRWVVTLACSYSRPRPTCSTTLGPFLPLAPISVDCEKNIIKRLATVKLSSLVQPSTQIKTKFTWTWCFTIQSDLHFFSRTLFPAPLGRGIVAAPFSSHIACPTRLSTGRPLWPLRPMPIHRTTYKAMCHFTRWIFLSLLSTLFF